MLSVSSTNAEAALARMTPRPLSERLGDLVASLMSAQRCAVLHENDGDDPSIVEERIAEVYSGLGAILGQLRRERALREAAKSYEVSQQGKGGFAEPDDDSSSRGSHGFPPLRDDASAYAFDATKLDDMDRARKEGRP